MSSKASLGWTDSRNVQIDYRWGAGAVELYRRYAAELLALTPDVILSTGTPVVDERCRSCSCRSPTRSAPGMSKA
jgi:hypothetical protein